MRERIDAELFPLVPKLAQEIFAKLRASLPVAVGRAFPGAQSLPTKRTPA